MAYSSVSGWNDSLEKKDEEQQGKRKYYIKTFSKIKVTEKCTSLGGFPIGLLHFNCSKEHDFEWQKQTIKNTFAWSDLAASEHFSPRFYLVFVLKGK